ncbi:DUF6331 family protein [uncultured Capnocytophaga sp.]|uniref:DUF6331 family protein n=1 Tax=uncultured Capnocytophaga sp. TaxID=159273 RepID=UPI0026271AB7|nr:DUF6331 family protein [uncultured Capnocytophaga sp.]
MLILPMPILINNNLFIKELPIDYNGKLLDLDPYIVPLNIFFNKLEVECVRECCGIQAFSFMPEDIHKALVGLSTETIVTQLKAMQTTIEEQWWYNTVGSTILNNNFDRKVFLRLLAHIIKTIESQ